MRSKRDLKIKLKRPSYYSHMPTAIIPEEYLINYQSVKENLLKLIERDWGKPCETKDTDDFPELSEDPQSWRSRCPKCLLYEKVDNLFEMTDLDEDD